MRQNTCSDLVSKTSGIWLLKSRFRRLPQTSMVSRGKVSLAYQRKQAMTDWITESPRQTALVGALRKFSSSAPGRWWRGWLSAFPSARFGVVGDRFGGIFADRAVGDMAADRSVTNGQVWCRSGEQCVPVRCCAYHESKHYKSNYYNSKC